MNIFLEISGIIGIATIVALVMQYLKQPLILGHILTGIIVGPAVLNILRSGETIEVFSHLGITSLLFIVGLGLSPRIMREVGRIALIAGIGQVVFTTIFGILIGYAFGFGWITSTYLAVAFTFSSTIIVSKILSDKKDTQKLYGKIAIGMLLVQDVIATIALIAVTASMTGNGLHETILYTLLKSVVIGGGIYFASAYILPKLTSSFARSQEFLFLFSIGWGLTVAALFYVSGLSIELGALAAGVALASSPYHYEIEAKMKLLRDFFIVIFFILLGSHLTADSLSQFVWPIVAYSAFILIGNPLIVMTLMGWVGYSKKTGFLTGLTVAQISEFSLILLILGIKASHLPSSYLSLATVVGMVTIALSAVMMIHAETLYRFCAPILGIFERRRTIPDTEKKETYDILLFGCHRVGSDFLPSILKRRKSYLVVDFDPQVIERLKRCDVHARYGDAGDDAFLESLRLDKIRLAISTIPDFETNALLLDKIRNQNQRAVIILIAQHLYEADHLYASGASYVVMPHHMGGNYAAMLVAKHGADPRVFEEEKRRHIHHLNARHLEGAWK